MDEYTAMWELVRPLVWAAHFDLADIRSPACRQPKRERRKLQHLRREVIVRLDGAGYSRRAISDFLFIDPTTVRYHIRQAGSETPEPGRPTSLQSPH